MTKNWAHTGKGVDNILMFTVYMMMHFQPVPVMVKKRSLVNFLEVFLMCCLFLNDDSAGFVPFKECEERELGAMRALRAHNRNKRDGDIPQEGATFCLCHKPPQPNMLTCSLCLDLFHSKCVIVFEVYVSLKFDIHRIYSVKLPFQCK